MIIPLLLQSSRPSRCLQDLPNGALASPLEYGSVLLGVLVVWRERPYVPSGRPRLPAVAQFESRPPVYPNATRWGIQDRSFVSKVADTLCMGAILEQKQKIVGLSSVKQVLQTYARQSCLQPALGATISRRDVASNKESSECASNLWKVASQATTERGEVNRMRQRCVIPTV
jgi:hypothetical protein